VKSVWVLGARGFIGRHLAIALADEGVTVAGLGHGLWPENESKTWGVHAWINGDVSSANLDVLRSRTGCPEAIFNLAGGSSVALAQQAPLEDFERTVGSAAQLFEWVRLHSPQTRVVLASSAAVYGNQPQQPIAESAVLAPVSCYGVHKRAAELLSESYARNFGIRSVAVRLFSVYGAGLRKQLLWDLCMRLEKGVALDLAGDGNEARDFIHVKDAARCLILAARQDDAAAINGCSGAALTVREVVESLCEAWGVKPPLSFNGSRREGDPRHLAGDAGRLRQLGFSPQWSWASGVRDYVEWFRNERRSP
jgi:UDP-glucose 4-epimerase